jgi:hypothetical protein
VSSSRAASSASDLGLTPEMAAAFAEDGYLLVEDFMPAEFCDRLQAQARALVADFDAEALCHRLLHHLGEPRARHLFPGLRRQDPLLLRGRGLRCRRQAPPAEGAVDQQDRPCHA